MIKNLWNALFVNTFKEVENNKSNNTDFDKRSLILFITVTLSLVFIQYFGDYNFLLSILSDLNIDTTCLTKIQNNFPNERLFQLSYWVFILIIFYLIFPLIIIKLVFKDKLSNYGLTAKGIFKSYKVYLFFFIFMIPLILLFSNTASFQHKYPFYNPVGESLWPNFIIWECLYFLQFFMLEFFFRGFMVHGLKRKFGFYSVFIMTVPYMMIHFQKPMPETIGAILAGIVLGTLSLKSKSIWLGVAIHFSVALSMDLAALWQKGYFNLEQF